MKIFEYFYLNKEEKKLNMIFVSTQHRKNRRLCKYIFREINQNSRKENKRKKKNLDKQFVSICEWRKIHMCITIGNVKEKISNRLAPNVVFPQKTKKKSRNSDFEHFSDFPQLFHYHIRTFLLRRLE